MIALVEGTVWGGACELVMGCDLVVAGSDTTFAITPAKLGVPYNIVGTLNFLNSSASRPCAAAFTIAPIIKKGSKRSSKSESPSFAASDDWNLNTRLP